MSVLYGSTSPPGSGGGGGAVSSVFTRTGAVVAVANDYTPAQVGAVPLTAEGVANGVATLDGTGNVPGSQLAAAIPASAEGTPNGVATLDATTNVPLAQLGNAPSNSGVASVVAGANVTIGGTAQNPVINAAQADPTVPTGYFYQSAPRGPGLSTATLADLTSGQIAFFAVTLVAGQVLTKIKFAGGTTAAVAPTHQWFALYDANLNALAATADGTNTPWAISTYQPLSIAFTYSAGAWHANASYTIPTTALYYIGIMVAATTVPTLNGGALTGYISQDAPVVTGSDTTHVGLTTPNSSPSPIVNSGGAPSGFAYFCLG